MGHDRHGLKGRFVFDAHLVGAGFGALKFKFVHILVIDRRR